MLPNEHDALDEVSEMPKTIISTNSAPKAIGPYSQAVAVNGTLYASGQIGINPETGELVDGLEAQARQIIKNIKAVLSEAGCSLDDVVKATVFMIDPNGFSIVNSVMSEEFAEPFPARSCVFVSALPKGALVEVEVVASTRCC